jgi:YbbR domain-containing protein
VIPSIIRVVRIVVHNWPLKVAAIVFASLLYGGLVLSQSARTFPGTVPILTTNQPGDVYVLSDLGDVSSIRYVLPESLGLRVDASSFTATVDLAGADPAAGPTALTVHVVATDPRIQVLDFSPRKITVSLDRITSRDVPIRAVMLNVPTGFELGDPQLAQTTATVRGPKSVVDQVAEVLAQVPIQPSGIDVNQVVVLAPVDATGKTLSPVDVTPASIQVKVAVFTDRRTKTLPVNPVVTGTPAAGFDVASVVVDPVAVSIQGDANDLAGIDRADTQGISVSGASSDITATVPLNLPNGVEALGTGTVEVTIHLRPVISTRTYEAGITLVGASPDKVYSLSTDRVLVTIGGSTADLDRLSATLLVLTVDVTGLGDGSHKLQPDANLTTGLSLISISPSPITVTIASSPPSPAPSPSP